MEIYVDGSAHPNPGPGGFGVVVMTNDKVVDCYTFQVEHTTNNEMELSAVLWAMIHYGKYDPVVWCDSAYVVNTLTDWMYKWSSNGWIKSNKKPPENLELIKAYYDLIFNGYLINLKKIEGHAGILGNELADQLATGKLTVNEVFEKYGNKEED